MTGKGMSDLLKKPERQRLKKQRVKSAMTGHDKLKMKAYGKEFKRMNKE